MQRRTSLKTALSEAAMPLHSFDGVAVLAGLKKLEWNGVRITNDEAVIAYLKKPCRKGRELAG